MLARFPRREVEGGEGELEGGGRRRGEDMLKTVPIPPSADRWILNQIFPGWSARFYTDMGTVPTSIIEQIREAGGEIVPVDMAKHGSQSMFWRFWAAADQSVASRDEHGQLICDLMVSIIIMWNLSICNFVLVISMKRSSSTRTFICVMLI